MKIKKPKPQTRMPNPHLEKLAVEMVRRDYSNSRSAVNLAIGSSSHSVRIEAVKKITKKEWLREIINNSHDSLVVSLARKKLNESR